MFSTPRTLNVYVFDTSHTQCLCFRHLAHSTFMFSTPRTLNVKAFDTPHTKQSNQPTRHWSLHCSHFFMPVRNRVSWVAISRTGCTKHRQKAQLQLVRSPDVCPVHPARMVVTPRILIRNDTSTGLKQTPALSAFGLFYLLGKTRLKKGDAFKSGLSPYAWLLHSFEDVGGMNVTWRLSQGTKSNCFGAQSKNECWSLFYSFSIWGCEVCVCLSKLYSGKAGDHRHGCPSYSMTKLSVSRVYAVCRCSSQGGSRRSISHRTCRQGRRREWNCRWEQQPPPPLTGIGENSCGL